MAKAAPSESQVVVLTHPESGRQMRIDAGTYEAVSKAILKSLKGSNGKSFTELKNDVAAILKKTLPGFKGSIDWYTITIKLNLETKKIVETVVVKGKKLNRLKK